MDNLSLPLPKPYARSIADDWQIPKALIEIPRWLVWRAKPRGRVDDGVGGAGVGGVDMGGVDMGGVDIGGVDIGGVDMEC